MNNTFYRLVKLLQHGPGKLLDACFGIVLRDRQFFQYFALSVLRYY